MSTHSVTYAIAEKYIDFAHYALLRVGDRWFLGYLPRPFLAVRADIGDRGE